VNVCEVACVSACASGHAYSFVPNQSASGCRQASGQSKELCEGLYMRVCVCISVRVHG
jgi:hypothetical protein